MRARQFLKEHRFPVMKTLALFPKVSKPYSIAIGILTFIAVSGTLVQMVVFGALVNAIGPAARSGMVSPEGRRLVFFLTISAAVSIGISLLAQLQTFVLQRFGYLFQLFLEQKGMSAALDPAGIAHMEDPGFLNELELALGMERYGGPANVIPQIVSLFQIRLAALGAAALLAGLDWWAPLAILIAAAIGYRWLVREMDLLFGLREESVPDSRRALYYRDLIVSPEAAKESRVFGLQDWLLDRYTGHWMQAMSRIWQQRRKLSSQMIVAGVVFAAAYALVFFTMATRAVSGEISIGSLAVYAQAALSMIRLVQEGTPIYMVRNGANSIERLVNLPQVARRLKPYLAGSMTDTEGMPVKEIQFDGVSFRYPGTSSDVIKGLDLRIPAQKSLAIVGVNGAGKTTLMKLLARLYDCDHGSITVDGTNLKAIDPKAWRNRVAVIFQDFLRFPLTARDNVGFGDLNLIGDEQVLREAAQLAGASALIEGLPHGWDTVLSKEFRDGVDLSGGEWQKVALARTLVAARQGGLLVLDEPTASLDVRAEAELFDRFLEVTRGVTTILVSHRFSSVRRADRICVLEEGQIIEEGTHDELMNRRGRYRQMFSLQAARFEGKEEAADV